MRIKAVFLRKTTEDKYIKVCEKRVKKDQTELNYAKNKSVLVRLKAVNHYDKNTAIIFYDYANGKPLTFHEVEAIMTPEEVDDLCIRKTWAGLADRVRQSTQDFDKSKIFTYLLILGFGGLAGFLIRGYMGGATPAASPAQGVAVDIALKIVGWFYC